MKDNQIGTFTAAAICVAIMSTITTIPGLPPEVVEWVRTWTPVFVYTLKDLINWLIRSKSPHSDGGSRITSKEMTELFQLCSSQNRSKLTEVGDDQIRAVIDHSSATQNPYKQENSTHE